VARHVWEALRFDPINPFVTRLSVAPYTVAAGTRHATEFPAGTLLLAATRSAMRDPSAVPEPETYRTDRPAHAYLHLGYGPHACLGAQVSLVQVPEIVRHILLLPGLRRAEGAAGRADFAGGPFPERFTVAFDAADGRATCC
jgi:cytochrome P450